MASKIVSITLNSDMETVLKRLTNKLSIEKPQEVIKLALTLLYQKELSVEDLDNKKGALVTEYGLMHDQIKTKMKKIIKKKAKTNDPETLAQLDVLLNSHNKSLTAITFMRKEEYALNDIHSTRDKAEIRYKNSSADANIVKARTLTEYTEHKKIMDAKKLLLQYEEG